VRPAPETATVERFVEAFQSGDARRIAAILTDDVRLSMPPEPIQCSGPEAVASYLRARGFWGSQLQLTATRANGQPAFGYYLLDPATDVHRLNGLIVLAVERGRIRTITRFGLAAIDDRFDLPLTLARPGAAP
jgi:RNA polymerase sigma-70 factor (ECF subfamily)